MRHTPQTARKRNDIKIYILEWYPKGFWLLALANMDAERAKVRRAMEQTLLATAMKIVSFANNHKDHIPPITTQAANPFPYKINIEQRETSWASRMRIY